MTIIDSERKRPDPVEEVAAAIYGGRNGRGALPWARQNSLMHSAYRGDATAAIQRMIDIGYITENGIVAFKAGRGK